jgi:sugar phosphate isomerase/epimerase
MAITLGCHVWTFPQCTVAEAAGIIRALGLDHMDLGHARDLDPEYVAGHVDEEAARLNHVKASAGVTFVDAFPQIGPAFSLNHPEPGLRAHSRRVLTAFLDFAVAIGLAGVTFTPGRYWAGHTPDDDFERGAEELRYFVAEGRQRGLLIRIEPHIESVTWTPELTLRMLAAVPGLSLTLDYSHFVFHAIPHDHIAVLDPHATHWHARQAAPGQGQAATARGTIDFAAIVRGLKARGYNGTICLEYVHGDWLGMGSIDCVSETVRLRDVLRAMLEEA